MRSGLLDNFAQAMALPTHLDGDVAQPIVDVSAKGEEDKGQGESDEGAQGVTMDGKGGDEGEDDKQVEPKTLTNLEKSPDPSPTGPMNESQGKLRVHANIHMWNVFCIRTKIS